MENTVTIEKIENIILKEDYIKVAIDQIWMLEGYLLQSK